MVKQYRGDGEDDLGSGDEGRAGSEEGIDDDVATLAPLVNAYLLRFYFQIRGMPEPEFIARLHALKSAGAHAAEAAHHG